MTKKERAALLVEALKNEYPEAVCSLVANNPFELLVATRLSAQCTDARVNLVTPQLFAKYKTLDDYCNADVLDVENIIHSCGFYHGKARDIIEMAKVFAIDKLEIDPEYLKTIYNTYYKKCKTPISKFGIKLSYYNSLLIKKLNDKSIEISKEELEELFKLGIFQKCLDEKWAIIIPFNGPFCSQFNDYIINKDEKPNYILESDINIINY